MSRIPFISALLILLIASFAATAQERGDGEADSRRQIHDKDLPNGRGRGLGKGRHRGGDGSDGNGSRAGLSNGRRFRGGFFRRAHNNDAPGEPAPFTQGRTEMGVKLGVNFQELAKSPFSPTFTPGIVGGGYIRRYYRRTGVRAELLASTASYTSQNPAAYYAQHTANMDTVTKSKFKTLYLSVPILFEQRMFRKAYLQIGPQISYLLSSSDKNGQFTKIYTKDDIFKKAEFSMVFGADFQLPHQVRLGARYVKGLTDVNNSVYPRSYFAWTINSLQVTASYALYRAKPHPPRLIPEKAEKDKKKEKKK